MVKQAIRILMFVALCSLIVAARNTGEKTGSIRKLHDIAWGQEVAGWRVGICLARKTFASGEPIVLSLTTENASGERRILRDYGPERDWEISVVRKPGFTSPETYKKGGQEQLPLTLYGRKVKGMFAWSPRSGSLRGSRLESGESRTRILWLDRMVDLSLHGHYTMVATRKILYPDWPDVVEVSSGPLEIEVLSRKALYQRPVLLQILNLPVPSTKRSTAAMGLGEHLIESFDILSEAAKTDADSGVRMRAAKQLKLIRARVMQDDEAR